MLLNYTYMCIKLNRSICGLNNTRASYIKNNCESMKTYVHIINETQMMK